MVVGHEDQGSRQNRPPFRGDISIPYDVAAAADDQVVEAITVPIRHARGDDALGNPHAADLQRHSVAEHGLPTGAFIRHQAVDVAAQQQIEIAVLVPVVNEDGRVVAMPLGVSELNLTMFVTQNLRLRQTIRRCCGGTGSGHLVTSR